MTEWKNTDEWTPPNGERVLVFVGKGNPPRTEISKFNLALGRWDGFDVDEITHWAEMPTFPPLAVVEKSFVFSLSKERQQELLDHLADKFESDYAKFCVVSLALDIECYEINEETIAWTDADYRRKSDASHAAWQLYSQCRDNPRLKRYAAYCWVLASELMVTRSTASLASRRSMPGQAACPRAWGCSSATCTWRQRCAASRWMNPSPAGEGASGLLAKSKSLKAAYGDSTGNCQNRRTTGRSGSRTCSAHTKPACGYRERRTGCMQSLTRLTGFHLTRRA